MIDAPFRELHDALRDAGRRRVDYPFIAEPGYIAAIDRVWLVRDGLTSSSPRPIAKPSRTEHDDWIDDWTRG